MISEVKQYALERVLPAVFLVASGAVALTGCDVGQTQTQWEKEYDKEFASCADPKREDMIEEGFPTDQIDDRIFADCDTEAKLVADAAVGADL